MVLERIKNKISKTINRHDRAVSKWYRDNAENTLRYEYGLNENSLVLDLGGYKGDFTYGITNKYNCKVMVFEPVPEFANAIKERFITNNKVDVYTLGLEDTDSIEKITMEGDGSSSFRLGQGEIVEVFYYDVEKFFGEKGLKHVDLMKINIEGGEYNLLEKMISSDLITRVDNIQIQFHNIKEIDSKKRMRAIIKELSKTHFCTWKYRPFVWENWKRK